MEIDTTRLEFLCTSCVPDTVLSLTISVITLAPRQLQGGHTPTLFPEELEHLTQEQTSDEKLSSSTPDSWPQSHALLLCKGPPDKGLAVTLLRS